MSNQHLATDLFIKAMERGGHIVLKPNQKLLELPDDTIMVVDIVPDESPTMVTLTLSDK